MFDSTTRVRETMLAIIAHDGDVFVLCLTSWWRRWLNMEIWAVAIKRNGELFVTSLDGKPVRRFGHMDVVDDPNKWPDAACAAVAKWTLINA